MKSGPMTVHNYVKKILDFEFGTFQTFTKYIEIEYILFDQYILCSLQINFQMNVTVEKCTFSPLKAIGKIASATYLVAIGTRLP